MSEQPSSRTNRDVPRRMMGDLDELPNWVSRCTTCGVLYDEQVSCPVCSLRTETDQ